MAKDIREFTLPRLNPQISPAQNVQDAILMVPLDGQWVPSANAAQAGKNFRTMTNMRYGENHPVSVMGMTKINSITGLTTNLKVRSAHHLVKNLYPETHILVQAFNTGLTSATVAFFSQTIPSTGNFNEYLVLDVAPATSWTPGDTITGATSGKTCKVLKKINSMNYLVSGRNGTFTLGEVLSNGTYTADQGAANPTFTQASLWTDTAGAGFGYFCDSPNGQMIYANGKDVCIWDGFEAKCGAIIASSATLTSATDTPTNPKDITQKLTNKSETADNVFSFGGQIDSYTKLLLAFNGEHNATTTTDGSPDTVAMTSRNGAKLSTIFKKFGSASSYFDGTDDHWDTPDSASWNFSTGDFTIETWAYLTATSGTYGYMGQYADADNYWYLKEVMTYTSGWVEYWGGQESSVRTFTFKARSGGTTVADYTFALNFLSSSDDNTWVHLAISRQGSNLRFFYNGNVITDGSIAGGLASCTVTTTQAIGSSAMPDVAAVLTIGRSANTSYMKGYLDEARISKGIARYTSTFVPQVAGFATPSTTLLIGTTRHAEALKLYIPMVNTVATTMTAKIYNGASWESITIDDETSVNSISGAQTGVVYLGDQSEHSQPKFIEGYYLYWYLISIDAGGFDISNISVDMPFQAIGDVWDGNFRDIAACYKTTSTSSVDITLNVRNFNTYVSEDDGTYANLNSLPTTTFIDCGFITKQTAIFIAVPDNYTNSNASVLSVSCWDGNEYRLISGTVDGTSVDGKTLARSGVVSWNNPDVSNETQKSTAGSFPFYYYRLSVSGALDASVRVYYIAGIPIPQDITGYSFCLTAADRLMLGDNNNEYRNALLVGAQDRPEVLNGDDSQIITFGDDDKLTCAAAVYAQYSSNIYNIVIVLKARESWILQWNQSTTGVSWSRFRISPTVGCNAPMTLKTASVIFEQNINQAKNIAIWRANDGIYLSNGQSPFCVSNDIKNVFDQNETTHVNLSMAGSEFGFVDEQEQEYHWLWASGTSTTLDKEYVLDMKKWRWYEIDRASGNRLQCGLGVSDTYGSKYSYGFIDTGYMERLEHGTTFDGTAIASTLFFGEQLPVENNLAIYTSIEKVNLIAVPKTTSNTVTMTHYLDGASSGTDYSLSIADSTHSYSNTMKDIYSNPAVFHGFKLVHSSSVETKGFEPLYMTVTYQKVREHTR